MPVEDIVPRDEEQTLVLSPQSLVLLRIGDAAIARLEAVNGAREKALADTRQIVRLSANAIRAVHRGDLTESDSLLERANAMHTGLRSYRDDFPPVYWAGYVQDAQKEYVEARIVRALIGETPLPSPADLDIDESIYLNGLGEAAGELRRHLLDLLRAGDVAAAETTLAIMDDIFGLLVTVDYPDAVTHGLRRTTDLVRAVLERSRGDLTLTARQMHLEAALRARTGN
ncbi:MAG: haloacid dehalogenase [Thermomicrobiales bacterium]